MILAAALKAPLPVTVTSMPPAAVLLIAYVGTAPALKNRYPNVVTVTTGTLPPQECAVAVILRLINRYNSSQVLSMHFLLSCSPAFSLSTNTSGGIGGGRDCKESSTSGHHSVQKQVLHPIIQYYRWKGRLQLSSRRRRKHQTRNGIRRKQFVNPIQPMTTFGSVLATGKGFLFFFLCIQLLIFYILLRSSKQNINRAARNWNQ